MSPRENFHFQACTHKKLEIRLKNKNQTSASRIEHPQCCTFAQFSSMNSAAVENIMKTYCLCSGFVVVSRVICKIAVICNREPIKLMKFSVLHWQWKCWPAYNAPHHPSLKVAPTPKILPRQQ